MIKSKTNPYAIAIWCLGAVVSLMGLCVLFPGAYVLGMWASSVLRWDFSNAVNPAGCYWGIGLAIIAVPFAFFFLSKYVGRLIVE